MLKHIIRNLLTPLTTAVKATCFLSLLLLPFFCFSQLTGKVVSISDGDTFTLLTPEQHQIKIRLCGIDCPEKGQPFGNAAKKYLSVLIFCKEVHVIDKGLDRYGRTVGIAIMSDTNVNELMLKEGYAWHYKQYDHDSLWDVYENNARKLRKGLWADKSPIEPSNWRHSLKENNYRQPVTKQ